MDKKKLICMVAIAALGSLVPVGVMAVILAIGLGSAPREKLPYAVMIDNREYVIISWDGRQYVPYCAISKSARGKQIGIVYGEENEKIYEYKGYPTEEWIINALDMDGGAMLYREVSVTEIPAGLESEYHWNQNMDGTITDEDGQTGR